MNKNNISLSMIFFTVSFSWFTPSRVLQEGSDGTLPDLFLYVDFGKEFPSRTVWRGPSRRCPSPSSALCALLYRAEHFSRGEKGDKVPRKEKETGWPAKGGKKGKRTRENRSDSHREKSLLKKVSSPANSSPISA